MVKQAPLVFVAIFILGIMGTYFLMSYLNDRELRIKNATIENYESKLNVNSPEEAKEQFDTLKTKLGKWELNTETAAHIIHSGVSGYDENADGTFLQMVNIKIDRLAKVKKLRLFISAQEMIKLDIKPSESTKVSSITSINGIPSVYIDITNPAVRYIVNVTTKIRTEVKWSYTYE